MQIIRFFFYVFMIVSVQAGVNYFKEPMLGEQYQGGSTIYFLVSQLPDIDQQTVYANLYREGGSFAPIATLQSWSPSSIVNTNDFTFEWTTPSSLSGQYYVKIDVANDQDDNDIWRSYTFTVHPSATNMNYNMNKLNTHNNQVVRPVTQPSYHTNDHRKTITNPVVKNANPTRAAQAIPAKKPSLGGRLLHRRSQQRRLTPVDPSST
ncbi:uncharacterized protein BX664DRAFT_316692 [Halteromyces radiatus]|uniref:uncharacterized protein n=1 Tax=Halteromyces radiatus TaxID=101107 RepID=UPI00221FA48B|nr:uncharacterized protein BX664DRAFT_316692 [Halteromyces radiatus]KAI8085198.1 hypothetical protein BX664DRAFT_316692 [Halteromyces radiatus]